MAAGIYKYEYAANVFTRVILEYNSEYDYLWADGAGIAILRMSGYRPHSGREMLFCHLL